MKGPYTGPADVSFASKDRLRSANPLLIIRDLQVQRGGRAVLEVDHLMIENGQVLALIGPNGAGKSTLLLAIARLLEPAQGKILFAGQPIDTLDVLAYRRRLSLVLQEPLLLDRSVFDNVAAGLRFRGLAKDRQRERVEIWLERLGITGLRDRPARTLSGGEGQRVSLARAFALHPELLLLDEPFSALDPPTRLSLLEDLQGLLAETGITTVFVTHDQDEALLLGDQVAVLLEGKLRQAGSPQAVFSAPVDEEVAAFVGVETVIPGQVVEVQDGTVTLLADGAHIQAVGIARVFQPMLACLRPEDITLWPSGGVPASSARNRLHGRIQRMIPLGPLVRVVVDCGIPVVALITRASAQELGLKEGSDVIATFKASAVHLISRS